MAGRGAGARSYRERLLPGSRVLAAFRDDPGFYHERVMLWPISQGGRRGTDEWVIRTSDGDEYSEFLDDWHQVWELAKKAYYPAGLVGTMITFKDAIEDDEMERMVVRGR